MKVALCAIGRLENNYIREWVEHYKMLGFDNIILYDNNYDGEDHFEDVISDYIDSGFVILKDVRSKGGNIQIQSYDECYHNHSNDYDWIAFFDIDEFLTLDKKFNSIKDYLSCKELNNFNCIRINWIIYDDNNLINVKNNDYSVKRFDGGIVYKNKQCKSIIKTKLNIRINSSHGAEIFGWTTGKKEVLINKNSILSCNSDFIKCSNNKNSIENACYNNAYIKHYMLKTIEEFIVNKSKRGYPTTYLPKGGLSFNYSLFFKYNKKTKEKLDFIKSFEKNNTIK